MTPITKHALAGERLAQAIEERGVGKTTAEKVDSFHQDIRAMGITGVHGTRHTLNRWLTGRGTPPEYWLKIAAELLEVNPRWLYEGEGVMVLGGEPLESEAAEDAPGSAGGAQAGGGRGKGPEAREKGSQKPERGDSDDLPGDLRIPPDEEPEGPPLEIPDEEPDEEEADPPLEAEALTLPDILEMNSVKAQRVINSTQSIQKLDALEEMEKRNPTYEGGRTTVLDAIGIQRRSLGGD